MTNTKTINETIIFIEALLLHNNTEISSRNMSDGFVISNSDLNSHISIFSDSQNAIYIEFGFLDNNKSRNFYTVVSTYRDENIEDYIPTLTKITNIFNDQKIDFEIKMGRIKSRKYIDLFLKVLANETLPENIFIKHTPHKIELREKNIRAVHYIENSSINSFKSWINSSQEPTHMMHIYIQSPGEKLFSFYIPKFLAHKYPLLKPDFKIKNKESNTNSSSDWLKKLKQNSKKHTPQLSELIQYVELHKTLKTKDESSLIKSLKMKI